jgi:hypothetical protein
MNEILEAPATEARASATGAMAAPVRCWFCGSEWCEPFTLGSKVFCCESCAADWAE